MTTACIIAAACILIAGLFAVIVERTNERDEATAEAARVEALLTDLDAENTRLHLALTEAQIAAGVVVPLPGLRVVREASDNDWPPMNADDAMWSRLYDENGEHRG